MNLAVTPSEPVLPIVLPIALDGSLGTNRAHGLHKQIAADTDVEAVRLWLAEYTASPHTLRSYRKEAVRLLLWTTAPLMRSKPPTRPASPRYVAHRPTGFATAQPPIRPMPARTCASSRKICGTRRSRPPASICTPKTTSDIHKRHAAMSIRTSRPVSRRRSRKIRDHHWHWMLEESAGSQCGERSRDVSSAHLRCCHYRLELAWMGFLDVVSFL